MKKIIIIITLVLASWSGISAQTSDDNYTPLVREGSEWVYYSQSTRRPYKNYIMGDTIFNGKKYKMVIRKDALGQYKPSLIAFLREEDKRVYQVNYSSRFRNAPFGGIPTEDYETSYEKITYDFNDLEKFYDDWYYSYRGAHYSKQYVNETTDTCLLVDRKVYHVATDQSIPHNVIEGIGAYYEDYGDFIARAFIVRSGGYRYQLVSVKNGAGEYEYFNKDLYDKMMLSVHDANNDKTVDISDVNTVIDAILGLEKFPEYCYVTEDNDLDVADVNAVVNYILKNE